MWGELCKVNRINHTFWSTLLSVGLHGDVGVEVVQCTICLLATVPSAFVHALNLLISATWTLVLLRTWNWDERVDLGKLVLRCKKWLAIDLTNVREKRIVSRLDACHGGKHGATHSA